MRNRKFILFTDNPKDHRVRRFKEESKKRELNFVVINIYRAILTDKKIFEEDGNEIIINQEDIVWALSNLTTGHFIAKKLKMQNLTIWPNAEAVDFADKFFTNMFFSSVDIPTPKTVLVNSYHINKIVNKIGNFPCIIKKNVSTVGKFVEIVNSKEEAVKFIKNSFDKAKNNILPLNRLRFLLQEFIKESAGTDYRVLCLNGEIIGTIKRTAKEGFKSNVSLGGTAEQVKIDDKLREYSERIMKKGNLFYAGIDFIKRGDDYLAIEVNTSAQFKGFEAATGINVAGKIIEALLEK